LGRAAARALMEEGHGSCCMRDLRSAPRRSTILLHARLVSDTRFQDQLSSMLAELTGVPIF
jgi:hypothetical protein